MLVRRQSRFSGPDRGSRASARVLAILLLLVILGPPIPFGEGVDVRLQDFGIVLVGGALLLAGRWPRDTGLRRVLGGAPALFTFGALVLMLVHETAGRDIDARYVGFLGRTLELFVLALVVSALYIRAGNYAFRTVRRSIYAGAGLSAIWLLWQVIQGSSVTLIGGGFAASYGPRLIGDPAVFAAGALLTFICAVALAEWTERIISPQTVGGVLVLAGFLSLRVESRSALAALAALGAVTLAWTYRSRLVTWATMTCASLALMALVVATSSSAFSTAPTTSWQGRLSAEGVALSFDYRVRSIWTELWSIFSTNPLLGIGPGSLGTQQFPYTEAHNVFLRAMLDYGLIVGMLFLAVLILAGWNGYRLAQVAPGRDVAVYGRVVALMIVFMAVAGSVQDAATPVMSTHLTFASIGLLAGSVVQHCNRVHAPASKGS